MTYNQIMEDIKSLEEDIKDYERATLDDLQSIDVATKSLKMNQINRIKDEAEINQLKLKLLELEAIGN